LKHLLLAKKGTPVREETKKRLERAIWLQRGKWVAMGLAVIAGMAILLKFVSADASVENVRVSATVTRVAPLPSKPQTGLIVDVKLADGKVVEVIANQITDPKVGQQVEITEHRHATGRKNYSWK
jgi:hypothetical protein